MDNHTSSADTTRVAVIDMGSNSTRLLVADVEGSRVTEIERISTVTRLGRGVDTSGQLSIDAIEDVCASVGKYFKVVEELGDVATIAAVATSAVRDAANSAMFMAELRERFALDATILDGAAEARVTYVGTRSGITGGDESGPTLVVDIGGGSTELVIGRGDEIVSFASLQAGTVRHTERHLRNDPPQPGELDRLATDVGGLIAAATEGWTRPERGIAVAGTPTSLAAIDQGLVPYDPERVHGYSVGLSAIQRLFSLLATKPLEERLKVPGLHPGRAPTIVAGVVILIQVLRAFELDQIQVSEHDILYGVAIEAAQSYNQE